MNITFIPQLKTNRRNSIAAGALAAALLLLGGAAAIRAQAPAAATKPGKRILEVKLKNADTVKVIQEPSLFEFTGNVVFVTEETTLWTDLARFNRDTGVANSPGKLRIEDEQNTITGNSGVAYYKTRDANFKGNVKIVVRPRENNRTARAGTVRREFDQPATITCENVVYNWKTRKADASGSLMLKFKDRTVTADRALYDGRAEVVTLRGNVVAVTTKGDKFTMPEAVAVIKEGAERLDLPKGANGIFMVEVDEDEVPERRPDNAPATGGAGTAPAGNGPVRPMPVPRPRPSEPGPNTPQPNTPAPSPENTPPSPAQPPSGQP